MPNGNKSGLQVPEFKSTRPPMTIPPTEVEAWMIDQLDIQRQQNTWIMEQLSKGNDKFDKIEVEAEEVKGSIQKLMEWKLLITSSKTVLACFVSAVFIPLSLIVVAEWVKSRFVHH